MVLEGEPGPKLLRQHSNRSEDNAALPFAKDKSRGGKHNTRGRPKACPSALTTRILLPGKTLRSSPNFQDAASDKARGKKNAVTRRQPAQNPNCWRTRGRRTYPYYYFYLHPAIPLPGIFLRISGSPTSAKHRQRAQACRFSPQAPLYRLLMTDSPPPPPRGGGGAELSIPLNRWWVWLVPGNQPPCGAPFSQLSRLKQKTPLLLLSLRKFQGF